jgi:acyl dehydratase
MTADGFRTFTMSQDLIDAWAQLSTDRNPLHVSPEYAAGTPFGGTIAHGHFTLSLMEELMQEIAGDRWLRGGLLHRVRFRAPVRPGETYALSATAVDGSVDTWRLELRDQGGEEVLAAEAEAELGEAIAWATEVTSDLSR